MEAFTALIKRFEATLKELKQMNMWLWVDKFWLFNVVLWRLFAIAKKDVSSVNSTTSKIKPCRILIQIKKDKGPVTDLCSGPVSSKDLYEKQPQLKASLVLSDRVDHRSSTLGTIPRIS